MNVSMDIQKGILPALFERNLTDCKLLYYICLNAQSNQNIIFHNAGCPKWGLMKRINVKI